MDDSRLRRLPLRENLTGQGLILATLALMALGLVVISSTSGTLSSRTLWYNRPDTRQAMYAVVAVAVLCLLWRMDYHWLARRPFGWEWLAWVPAPATVLLVLGLLLSVVVLVPHLGFEVGGQRRWLKFGPVQLQPSEVLKFALVIFLAVHLSRHDVDVRSFKKTFLPLLALLGLSAVLVVKYNFSTAAVLGVAAGGMLLLGGVRWYYLGALLPLAAGAFYLFVRLDQRRWERIVAFTDPLNAANPSAFQSGQALMWAAMGVDPPGLGAGAAKYGFLPEDDTDFIFTTISYEGGLIAALLVIGLLLLWLLLVRRAVGRSPDRLGALLAGGVGFTIILQAALHIAVTLVCMPTTGISLPFVSVGGTALLMMCAATAMVVSVTARTSASSVEPRQDEGLPCPDASISLPEAERAGT